MSTLAAILRAFFKAIREFNDSPKDYDRNYYNDMNN